MGVQRLCFEMGLPRLSPESSLLEVVFDALYTSEVIEEKYYDLWAVNGDDTEGKTKSIFQIQHFLDWLRDAGVAGETSSDSQTIASRMPLTSQMMQLPLSSN